MKNLISYTFRNLIEDKSKELQILTDEIKKIASKCNFNKQYYISNEKIIHFDNDIIVYQIENKLIFKNTNNKYFGYKLLKG